MTMHKFAAMLAIATLANVLWLWGYVMGRYIAKPWKDWYVWRRR